MPASSRREIVDESAVESFHCINRCVRQAYLCGKERKSGKNYEHRKSWVVDRLKLLSKAFLIEIQGYAVMSNHLHLLLRTRPDIVENLSSIEIAERWWRLFPQKIGKKKEEVIQKWSADSHFISVRRRRLSSLSWFMRCLAEPIARKANAEDGVKGRFWEGRFKSIKLLDDSARLAVAAYIDLNPVRADSGEDIEVSPNVSFSERVARFEGQRALEHLAVFDAGTESEISGPFLKISEKDYVLHVRAKVGQDGKRLRAQFDFLRKFKTAMGRAESMKKEAERRCRKWLAGSTFPTELAIL